ncbi:hypothetical protein [Paucihalobacter sp.]|uniref:hypothetical protein n=1 Tax=Paucihalobacter sp. TaxID=2850405 RepID=UPI002FE1B316
MKTTNIVQIKKELQHLNSDELIELCLRLTRFKKENKSLLTYLLFEAHDEAQYIASVKESLNQEFQSINSNSYFYIKKSVRKILRQLKTYARYSLKKETEVELLLYFCAELNEISPNIHQNITLSNLYDRQIIALEKKITTLHEDLQFDYRSQIEALKYYN